MKSLTLICLFSIQL